MQQVLTIASRIEGLRMQLNRIMLEKVEEDLQQADELIGQVHLTVRQSGHSVASENAMKGS